MTEPMYRPHQAAEKLGISERDVRAAVANGELMVIQIGRGTTRPRYLIPESAIEKWQSKSQRIYSPTPKTKHQPPSAPHRRKYSDAPAGMEINPRTGKPQIARKRD